ncbi:hypothetical protein C8Q74DRAFT_709429 [Fomes fomentarius]|nr:hypothetical protein C8Q74DRAFT_709429 [Fomes fomentarius]
MSSNLKPTRGEYTGPPTSMFLLRHRLASRVRSCLVSRMWFESEPERISKEECSQWFPCIILSLEEVWTHVSHTLRTRTWSRTESVDKVGRRGYSGHSTSLARTTSTSA